VHLGRCLEDFANDMNGEDDLVVVDRRPPVKAPA
jgi:hypothetical protein